MRWREALIAEKRKLTSTAMWWVLAIGMVGYLAFIGAVLAFSMVSGSDATGVQPLTGKAAALSVYGTVNAIGYVFPLVIGTLTVTTEMRHRTLTQSLLAEPVRGRLLSAKLAVSFPVGVCYGVLGVIGLLIGGAIPLATAGDGAYLGDGEVIRVLVMGILVSGLWAVLGAAFGSVVTNQVAAIVVLLAFTQLVEPIARVGLSAVSSLAPVASYLPGAAADAVVGSSLYSSVGTGAVDLLPAWGGALVLLGYGVVLVVLGWRTTFARDVT
ncbi:ABC transporter permease [Nocardioides acrostichi]|uniref:ABC transporter permease n=1 Tax=Nocardioides acrostichi TaxID=2784339 RepID=A0A930Y8A8_9ACTN|nr:ABC transporter permease [Nocardioides acrostichi]MBF4162922.1 ABC transporter permease [Nocardioides acrostichi]